jgi:prepilin-type N-terminal cleavage/methylation domain-containing protein
MGKRLGKDRKKGFTLIELMVSMVIFVVFLGIVTTSYISIVRAQKDTNDIRKMYSEVRAFVDMLSSEAKLGTIDYDCYYRNPLDTSVYCPPDVLVSISDGSMQKTIFRFVQDKKNPDNNKVRVAKYEKGVGGTWKNAPGYNGFTDIMGDMVKVEKLSFAISPDVNPYSQANYNSSAKQFQPKVTLYMTAKSKAGARSAFSMDFQTTISSRVYSRL